MIEKQLESPGYLKSLEIKGGPGSGNYGHAGRPGSIGGSSSGGGGGSRGGGVGSGRGGAGGGDIPSLKERPEYVRMNFLADSVRRKRISDFRMPAVDEKGDKIPGKEDSFSASIFFGELRKGSNKGKTGVLFSSGDAGVYLSGLLSKENFNKIGKTVRIENLYKMGLSSLY